MLDIQNTYHLNGAVYVDFNLNGKNGKAGLQLPYSQVSRCGIGFDGAKLEQGALYQWFLVNLMIALRQRYPDLVKRSLFYAGCDVENIEDIASEWLEGQRKYTVEFKDGATETYKEVPGVICVEGFYLVKEK